MLLTAADAARRALITLLKAQQASLLAQVQVEYVDPGQETWRECIYPGTVTWTNTGSDYDTAIRQEIVTIPLFVRVIDPAKTPEETDQRAVAIGQVVSDVLVANKPAGTNSWWAIVAGELLPVRTGDESVSTLTLQIEVATYL
jgi:hypothetical protein